MTNLKILYVEDEPDIRNIAKIAMESVGGFTVRDCASGYEACDAVAVFTPDLVILDMMMPGLNGLETFEKLQAIAKTRTTPTLFMTAKVQTSEISNYLNCGALDVIAKPFNPLELPVQIQKIWDHYQATSENAP